MLKENFWQDQKNSKKILKEKKLLENLINSYSSSIHQLNDLNDLYKLAIEDGNKIIQNETLQDIQDLRNLSLPNKVKIDNVQNLSDKYPRSSYVWHLVFCFDNGIKIDARNKQDSGTMATTPKLKLDWQVIDWGNSGMIEKIL